jgi:hypothetical protein
MVIGQLFGCRAEKSCRELEKTTEGGYTVNRWEHWEPHALMMMIRQFINKGCWLGLQGKH